MNKLSLKIGIGAALVIGVGVIALASLASAQTALTASCTGTVSGATVTWTATSTGGVPPYTFLWSGDPSVANNTSTSFTVTYVANGTYNATATVTDASSTPASASANCSATVNSIVVPVPTSTLNVVLNVSNTAGGSAVPSNFTVSVSGANANPSSFTGSSSGTAATVNANSTYAVSATALTNYVASMSGNCTGPIAAGAAGTCTVTETYTPGTPAPTMKPMTLSINPNGHFLAHGMIVTSVGSTSFQAQVWGITYTVNWSGNLAGGGEAELWFRNGPAGSTSTVSSQLAVGDEVGISGMISSASPLVVNADVVRDYTITQARSNLEMEMEQHQNQDQNQNGNGQGNEGENGGQGNSNVADIQSRLQELLGKLKNLQDLFHGRGNSNGNGNGSEGN